MKFSKEKVKQNYLINIWKERLYQGCCFDGMLKCCEKLLPGIKKNFKIVEAKINSKNKFQYKGDCIFSNKKNQRIKIKLQF